MQICGNPGTHHLETVWVEVWKIKKEKTVWSRVIRTSPEAYILPANLTLATASSLDGDKKERERERERIVKDELMAKVKETEWWNSVSPYRRSKIDPGVLELSKPDSWGTIPQVCSPTWTNKDIRDIDACWTTGHCFSTLPLSISICLQKGAAATAWLYFWFVMSIAILQSEIQAFYTLSNWCSFYPVCAQPAFLFLRRDKLMMSDLEFSHDSSDDGLLPGPNTYSTTAWMYLSHL